MTPTNSARLSAGLLATITLALTAAAVPAASAAPATAPASYNHQGYAYGTAVKVGAAVTSGPSAPVALGCTTGADVHHSNTSGGVSRAPLLTTGTVATTADTASGPTSSTTTARTEGAKLLGGLVKGSVIKAVSTTTATGGGLAVSAAGTNFTGLMVAGQPVAAHAAPNTRINLAGLGYVVLNEQTRSVAASSATLTVNAVHLVVTKKNTLGVRIGTSIVVSHAVSGLDGPVAGILSGYAYGTRAAVLKTVKSGPSFRVMMPCLGTDGNVRANTGAGVTVKNLLTSGTVRDTVQGSMNGSSARAETTSTVQNADVLAGLVTASTVTADATVVKTGSAYDRSAAGSSFGKLSVKGHPEITADVRPNTAVQIRGVGTLYLHRVITTAHGVQVRMIELQVTHATSTGPALGTDLRVGVAYAAAN